VGEFLFVRTVWCRERTGIDRQFGPARSSRPLGEQPLLLDTARLWRRWRTETAAWTTARRQATGCNTPPRSLLYTDSTRYRSVPLSNVGTHWSSVTAIYTNRFHKKSMGTFRSDRKKSTYQIVYRAPVVFIRPL